MHCQDTAAPSQGACLSLTVVRGFCIFCLISPDHVPVSWISLSPFHRWAMDIHIFSLSPKPYRWWAASSISFSLPPPPRFLVNSHCCDCHHDKTALPRKPDSSTAIPESGHPRSRCVPAVASRSKPSRDSVPIAQRLWLSKNPICFPVPAHPCLEALYHLIFIKPSPCASSCPDAVLTLSLTWSSAGLKTALILKTGT